MHVMPTLTVSDVPQQPLSHTLHVMPTLAVSDVPQQPLSYTHSMSCLS